MRPSLRKLAPLHSAADVPALPEVFILWHPDGAHGHPIAWQIRRWLRPSAGQGPQVFYRSQPAPGGGSRLPLPLPGEPRPWPPGIEPQMQRPKLQIVVLLLDHHRVTDPAWRWWMEQLSLPHSQRQGPPLLFLPVALTTTAFNAPVEIAKQNFLRIADVTALDPAALWVEPSQSPLLGSLLKPLTEALCRVVLAGPATDAARSSRQSAALRLFISHAKVDGAGPASRLRDSIDSRTQLAAFFDENNIPYGDSFAAVLQRALADGETAALIAVVSDRYASRPWCRRELRTFCRPQRVMEAPVEVWAMHPVRVVDYLEGEQLTRGLAELATVPVLRWQDNLPDMRQKAMIVTLLLREIFFDGYARRVAQHFALTASGAIDHAPELTPEFYANPVPGHDDTRYARMVREWPKLADRLSPAIRSPAQAFEALRRQLRRAVADPLGFFQNGLSVADNRRLLSTVDPLEATRLVLRGLDSVRYWADVAEADGSI